MLEDAGARQADVLVALTPEDQDNLIACQVARQMFGVPRVLALVNDPDNEEIFKRLGVTEAFSATHHRHAAGGTGGAGGSDQPAADGGRAHPGGGGGDRREGAGATKTLQEFDLPADTLVAGIIRGEMFTSRAQHRLYLGDKVILIGRPASFGEALRAVAGEEA